MAEQTGNRSNYVIGTDIKLDKWFLWCNTGCEFFQGQTNEGVMLPSSLVNLLPHLVLKRSLFMACISDLTWFGKQMFDTLPL